MKKRLSNGLLVVVLAMINVYSYSQCAPGQAELFITSSGGSYPSEKWMSITTDSAGAGTVLWDQGSGVYGASSGLLTNQSVCVTKGVDYFINAYDSYADGWDGTTYELTDASATVVANNGGVSPDDGTDLDASSAFGDTQAQELESSERFSYCEPGDSEYFITSSGGIYASEKWMSITTDSAGAGTVLWDQGGGVYGAAAGLLTDHKVCISGGIDFFINAYDSYADGWDGTTYELRDDVGALIANNGGVSPDDGTNLDATGAFGDTQPQELESSEKVIPLTYVPDDAFEHYLETHDAAGATVSVGDPTSMGNGVDYDDYVFTANINTVTDLDVSNSFSGWGITDLTGIEGFADLNDLRCNGNQLTSLDLSNNIALTYLVCSWNQLTSLDLSNNIALTYLRCGDNQLTSLDVSQFTALNWLDCGWNLLPSLDVSQNTALTNLNCWANQLTSLDVTQNTALDTLYCPYNQLTSLDVSQNTALTVLSCYENPLTSLDVSQNTALTELGCRQNQLTSLDVTQNIALAELYCDYNDLTSLDVTQNTSLTKLYCGNNQLTCLNVKNGNNTSLSLSATLNSLTCIEVDDPTWATANWTAAGGDIDAGVTFSTNCNNACSSVGIEEYSNQPRKLIRIIDLLGRETTFKPNTPLIYQYDDGSVEKVMAVW